MNMYFSCLVLSSSSRRHRANNDATTDYCVQTEVPIRQVLLSEALTTRFSGLLFELPMPVQPMKSVAAIAMAESHVLTIPQVRT